MADRQEAYQALDLFLFGNVYNNYISGPLGEDYEVTFYGDEYLVLHRESGEMFQFTVNIEDGGEHDFTQDIIDQEWFIDEEDETGGYKLNG